MDAVHFAGSEPEATNKQGMRLRVYRDVMMWICEARIQYGGIDNEGASPMTADKEIELG